MLKKQENHVFFNNFGGGGAGRKGKKHLTLIVCQIPAA